MKYTILFISIFSFIFGGQRLGDKAVRAGADAFYNYEYEKSIKILTKARKDYPEHPGVHVAWAPTLVLAQKAIAEMLKPEGLPSSL